MCPIVWRTWAFVATVCLPDAALLKKPAELIFLRDFADEGYLEREN
jgi:hypothetical protein